MTGAEPIRDDELAGLFAPIAASPLLLAVSGGPDSLALLVLVQRYVRNAGLPARLDDGRERAIVVTVDHGLRPESTAEARFVGAAARELGLTHHVLDWTSPKPQTGLQAAARRARYALIRTFLQSEAQARPRLVVTAHHREDQAETLLMRLARGSGVEGLAAMRSRSEAFGLDIVRPLLDVSKERLVATLAAAGRMWIEDPSNASEAFERARLRKAEPVLSSLGLTAAHIALSARRLARADDALEAQLVDLARRSDLKLHQGAFAQFDAAAFRSLPAEIGIRVLRRLLARFGGQGELPNLAQIEEAYERLLYHAASTFTLAGAIVEATDGMVCVYRELGRAALSEIVLGPGTNAIWDNRFQLSVAPGFACDVVAGALGEDGYRAFRDEVPAAAILPVRIAATLPAFRLADRLCAVPQLAFWAKGTSASALQSRFLGVHGLEPPADWPNS